MRGLVDECRSASKESRVFESATPRYTGRTTTTTTTSRQVALLFLFLLLFTVMLDGVSVRWSL
jgi:hypothetical protein